MDRLPIDDVTKTRLQNAASGLYGAWKRDAARNILRQGWISPRQKHHIFSKDYPPTTRTSNRRGGYDGPPDNAGNGYVTGE